MIKCEIIDNTPQYVGEVAHIFFYKGDKGQTFVIDTPCQVGDVITEPDAVKVIKARGYIIHDAYAIQDGDVEILRGMYANTANTA